ncbi:MAG: acyl-CoA dehydrogenase family protein [Dehalococcoidia bacterium]
MDLSLTPNQELLRNTAREFVQRDCPKEVLVDLGDSETGYTEEMWNTVSGIGWPGMLIPEVYGGTGGSLMDAAVVFEELGRGPLAGPYFSSGVLGALTVLEAGTEEQKGSILPEVAAGRQILSVAITEPDYGWGPEDIRMAAAVRNGTYVLNGTKLFVHDAMAATHFVCAVRTGDSQDATQGISLLVVDARAPGISRRSLPGFMTSVAEVTFDSVEVPQSALLGNGQGSSWHALDQAMQKAIPVLCAYKVGGCAAVFDISVDYSRTRMQFGTAIGRLQRVQDHIINIVNALDAARWATYQSLWELDTGRPATASVHMAKAVASDSYLKACNSAHEVHAGIGIVREYGLTLFTRMSRTLYHFLGDPKHHKRLLGQALDL